MLNEIGRAEIRNIYCIGRNYKLHAAELGNEVPEQPMVFMKPSHALVAMDGGEIRLPGQQGELHYEAELVIRIGRPYEEGVRAEQLIDAIALGIDFTLRDVQSDLKKKGHPWLAAKGFKRSAPITGFIPFPGMESVLNQPFSLIKNGAEAQCGFPRDMIFDFQRIVDFCAEHFGLDEGDVIFTGTPAGVAAVRDHDHLSLRWNNETLGDCTIRLI